MNFSEMNKEQKQLLVLAVGGTITIIAILSNLVIGPARAEAAEARKTIEELEDKVIKGERVLRRSVMVNRDVQNFASEVLSVHEEHLPPRISPYIWAVENLSLLAEDLDLVISVQEHPTSRFMPIPEDMEDLNRSSVPYWVPYTVDVDVNTSFAKLKSFLNLIHRELPYASVAGLQIQASSTQPERHAISMMLEWPTFRFPEDLEWLQNPTPAGESE